MKQTQTKATAYPVTHHLLHKPTSVIKHVQSTPNQILSSAISQDFIPSIDSFNNGTKELIKQVLKRKGNKPATKLLLDKLVASSKNSKKVSSKLSERIAFGLNQVNQKFHQEANDNEIIIFQDENKQINQRVDPQQKQQQSFVNQFTHSSTQQAQKIYSNNNKLNHHPQSAGQQKQQQQQPKSSNNISYQQSSKQISVPLKQVATTQIQPPIYEAENMLPSLILYKKEVHRRNNQKLNRIILQSQKGAIKGSLSHNNSFLIKNSMTTLKTQSEQEPKVLLRSHSRSRIKINLLRPQSHDVSVANEQQHQQSQILKYNKLNEISQTNNQKQENSDKLQNFNPQSLITSIGYQKVNNRPATDTKKKRNNSRKHIVIRDSSEIKKELVQNSAYQQQIQFITPYQEQIESEQPKQVNQQAQQDVYLFTFNNGDNPSVSILEKEQEMQQKIQKMKIENQKDEFNYLSSSKKEKLMRGSFSIQSQILNSGQNKQSNDKSAYEQDTFALSNSKIEESKLSIQENKTSSPNFNIGSKVPIAILENNSQIQSNQDIFTIKDYFDQEMQDIKIYKQKPRQQYHAYYQNLQHSQQDIQQPQIIDPVNSFQGGLPFVGQTPLIMKRPFSMNQKVRAQSTQSNNRRSRPISCAINKNSNLPACFLEDYSNLSGDKSVIPKRQQSAQMGARPPMIIKNMKQVCPTNVEISRNDFISPLQSKQQNYSQQFSTIQENQYSEHHVLPKTIMNSFEGNSHPNIPKPPQRRIQSSNIQYRKPVVSKKFLQKMLNSNVSNQSLIYSQFQGDADSNNNNVSQVEQQNKGSNRYGEVNKLHLL